MKPQKGKRVKFKLPINNSKRKSPWEINKFNLDLTISKDWKPIMKRLKKLLENSKGNLISIKWKLINYFLKSKTKGGKLWPTRKVWIEKLEAWKIKKENSNKESRVKLKEGNSTKPCLERSAKKENKKEGKPWSVNNKPWENSKPLPGKDKNSKESSKITNNKNNKIKTT